MKDLILRETVPTELEEKIKMSALYIYDEIACQINNSIPSNFMHADFLNSDEGVVNEFQAQSFDDIEAEIYTLTALYFNQEKWLECCAEDISFEEFLREYQREFEQEFFDNYYLYESEVIEEIQYEWVESGFLVIVKDSDSKIKEIYNKPFKEVW